MGTLPWLRFGCLFTWKHPWRYLSCARSTTTACVYRQILHYYCIFKWDESVCTRVFLHWTNMLPTSGLAWNLQWFNDLCSFHKCFHANDGWRIHIMVFTQPSDDNRWCLRWCQEVIFFHGNMLIHLLSGCRSNSLGCSAHCWVTYR